MISTPIPAPKSTAPPKAILPARDRLQSRLLVWTFAPSLTLLSIRTISVALSGSGPDRRHLLGEVAISLIFALLAWSLKAATPAAAACGGAICLLLTDFAWSQPPSFLHSGLLPLAILFALTFAATRYGQTKKELRGVSESRTGRRASQVIANLGIAALLVALGKHNFLQYTAALAALAEATADTVSSEIGQAIGGPTVLVTNFRRVSPGTDGAISLTGTFAGLLGAAAIVYVGLPHPFIAVSYLAAGAVFAAATLGLFFDSLLGATLERRGYLGNDLVNFLSTLFAAAVYFPLARIAMSFFKF